jgi:nitroreductase
MLLAAQALGFTANWKTGPAAYDAAVKQALGIDPDGVVIGIIYLGTQRGPQDPREPTLEGDVQILA